MFLETLRIPSNHLNIYTLLSTNWFEFTRFIGENDSYSRLYSFGWSDNEQLCNAIVYGARTNHCDLSRIFGTIFCNDSNHKDSVIRFGFKYELKTPRHIDTLSSLLSRMELIVECKFQVHFSFIFSYTWTVFPFYMYLLIHDFTTVTNVYVFLKLLWAQGKIHIKYVAMFLDARFRFCQTDTSYQN